MSIPDDFFTTSINLVGIYDIGNSIKFVKPAKIYSGKCSVCKQFYYPSKFGVRWHKFIRRHDPAFNLPNVEFDVSFNSFDEGY